MATHSVFFPGEPCEQYELSLYHGPIPNSWLSCGQDQGQGCCPMTCMGGWGVGCENRSDLDGTAKLKTACLLQRAATYYQKKKKCDFINHFPIPKYGIFGGANQVEMRCLFIKCLFGDAHPGWSYLWPSLLPWIVRWLTFSFLDPVRWLNWQG